MFISEIDTQGENMNDEDGQLDDNTESSSDDESGDSSVTLSEPEEDAETLKERAAKELQAGQVNFGNHFVEIFLGR